MEREGRRGEGEQGRNIRNEIYEEQKRDNRVQGT